MTSSTCKGGGAAHALPLFLMAALAPYEGSLCQNAPARQPKQATRTHLACVGRSKPQRGVPKVGQERDARQPRGHPPAAREGYAPAAAAPSKAARPALVLGRARSKWIQSTSRKSVRIWGKASMCEALFFQKFEHTRASAAGLGLCRALLRPALPLAKREKHHRKRGCARASRTPRDPRSEDQGREARQRGSECPTRGYLPRARGQ